ncbi:ATP-dependent DNA helicase [Rhodoferax sp. AJA081-3]|uniref:ATP-dependent DNA helicase n=1 Tax=Rhodoferax sp. AJA081-3 TaxID=2752316 RepID=UPI001AE0CB8E|nr:ATP-dependent DNA helicase [Rhodoferax sp. AJA081-3]QTN28741.1 ATP-dependent DNA helicase [Rhodoferax sp. AJA081-3]
MNTEAGYSVSVRNLCEFAAKLGDLDLRFTPSPTAQQGREGHQLVASRRAPGHEAEVTLSGTYIGTGGAQTDAPLRISGRADGYDPTTHVLEEVKTFRGALSAIAPNHRALHWAQLKVYGWLMCNSRALPRLTLSLVYFDVVDQTEHPSNEDWTAADLQSFFDALCARFMAWAQSELAHRRSRDDALQTLEFPQLPFRPGQRDLAGAVYKNCVQSRTLLAQAPTGIGKTIGTVFPALRAMPERGIDKLFFLTAKTPGRGVALEALHTVRSANNGLALRVLELVAKDKSCEHKDKACHGQSCPLAQGFYDRLPQARRAAAAQGWLDQQGLRTVALEHAVCPYYLGQEMVRWVDVVVGDYNYYFDRSAMLYGLTQLNAWRVSVLVDEAHNLYSRACSMYSADLTRAETAAVRPELPSVLRRPADDVLNQWDLLEMQAQRSEPVQPWRLLKEVPDAWLRSLQRFNSVVGEYLNDHSAEAQGAWLSFFFKTLAFATLAEEFGEHSLCELSLSTSGDTLQENDAASLTLRNIVPAHFVRPRVDAADSLVLFSATLNPADYYTNLLGLPDSTQSIDVPCPFDPAQLAVSVYSLSTRRDDRLLTLDALVDVMAAQYAQQRGNYLAFFSSFDYLELALARLQARHPDVPVWAQQRQMHEAARHTFLRQFDMRGQGIGFAVLGGVFGEGVDLPGKRLIGAFIATLGLPQFDAVNHAICERMQALFGRGHDYTYVYPGMQKVVQAAGRVIRTQTDTGAVLLLDERYREHRYRSLLPCWWRIAIV